MTMLEQKTVGQIAGEHYGSIVTELIEARSVIDSLRAEIESLRFEAERRELKEILHKMFKSQG